MGSPRVDSKLLYRARIGKSGRRFSLALLVLNGLFWLALLVAIRRELAVYYESSVTMLIGFVGDLLFFGAGLLALIHHVRKNVAVQWLYADRVITKTRTCRTERRFAPGTRFYSFRIVRNWVLAVAPGGRTLFGTEDPAKFRKVLEAEGYSCAPAHPAWEIGIVGISLGPIVTAVLKSRFGEAPFWASLALLVGLGVFLERPGRSLKPVTKWYRERVFGRPKWPSARRAAATALAGLAIYVGLVVVGYESPRDRRVTEIRALVDRGEFALARRAFDEASPGMTGTRFKNFRAWFLTTSPDPGLRDYTLAVASAKEAVALDSADRNALDTLACAEMGAGMRDEALRIATKSKLKKRIDLFAAGKLCQDEKMEKTFAARAIASVKKNEAPGKGD